MPTPIYDWEKLKIEFIEGEFNTLIDFLTSKGITNNGNTQKKVAGWIEAREDYKKKIAEKTIEQDIENEAQIRARQSKAAKLLQYKGIEYLKDKEKKPDNINDARRLVVEGLREEREALDLNKHLPIVAGSVNIAILQTRYGEMLKGLDYGELKQILERLEQLDSGGTKRIEGTNTPEGGGTEGTVV